jgi:quinol monooxygenase YgiN
MAEHAGLIQVTTFRPVPGQRDELLALCADTQERAAAADGCFGAQTCTVDGDPDAVVAISRWRDQHSLEAFRAAEGDSPSARVRDVLTDMPVTRQYTPVV